MTNTRQLAGNVVALKTDLLLRVVFNFCVNSLIISLDGASQPCKPAQGRKERFHI